MGRESYMQVMVVAIVILQDGKAKRRDDECTQWPGLQAEGTGAVQRSHLGGLAQRFLGAGALPVRAAQLRG